MSSTAEPLPYWSDPDRSEGALERIANDVLLTPAGPPVTPRMLEALSAMSRGLTYPEAAAEMGCGLETVKEHLKRARARLGARNTNEAIAEALRRGLIT